MGGHLENIFSSAIGHLPREIFDLALKASIKLKNWKKHKGQLQERKNWNEKLISKWEINIKDECENTLRSGLRLYFSREDSYLPLTIALGYYLPGSSLNWAFLVRYFRTHRLHEIWLKTYVRDNVRCNIIKTLCKIKFPEEGWCRHCFNLRSAKPRTRMIWWLFCGCCPLLRETLFFNSSLHGNCMP